MTKSEIIEYLYEINTHSDLTIEQMASDLANRPQGEWREDPANKNNMYCSNCKISYTKDFLRGMSLYQEPKDTPDFCPHCGARMKGASK